MQSFARRHFLIGSALASPLLSQSPNSTIGTGMIGVGNRGAYVMRGVLEEAGVRVAAICDTKPARLDSAATAAARHKPATYTDYRKLLDDKNVQAVFIATPCDLHVEMTIAALKAGKHVYCEKPVGITADSIRELLRVARASKTVYQVGQQLRSYTRMGEAIKRIHEGAIGKVLMVKAQRHQGSDLPYDGPSADWFFDVKRSGGYLVEMAVHNIDLCNWVIGSRPERAAGVGDILLHKNEPPGRSIMDGYSLTYDYQNGVKMSFSQLVFHPKGLPSGGQFVYVYGSKGAVDLMDTTMFYPLDGVTPPSELVPKRAADSPHLHVTAFFESVRSGKKPPADIEVGATAALTSILGHEAITRKKVMSWQDLGVDV